eukprot:g78994.t1
MNRAGMGESRAPGSSTVGGRWTGTEMLVNWFTTAGNKASILEYIHNNALQQAKYHEGEASYWRSVAESTAALKGKCVDGGQTDEEKAAAAKADQMKAMLQQLLDANTKTQEELRATQALVKTESAKTESQLGKLDGKLASQATLSRVGSSSYPSSASSLSAASLPPPVDRVAASSESGSDKLGVSGSGVARSISSPDTSNDGLSGSGRHPPPRRALSTRMPSKEEPSPSPLSNGSASSPPSSSSSSKSAFAKAQEAAMKNDAAAASAAAVNKVQPISIEKPRVKNQRPASSKLAGRAKMFEAVPPAGGAPGTMARSSPAGRRDARDAPYAAHMDEDMNGTVNATDGTAMEDGEEVRWAVAQYDLDATAANSESLSFRRGDRIKVLNMDGEWWWAELGDLRGYVPNNFFQLEEPAPAPPPATRSPPRKNKPRIPQPDSNNNHSAVMSPDASNAGRADPPYPNLLKAIALFDFAPDPSAEHSVAMQEGDVVWLDPQVVPVDDPNEWRYVTKGDRSGYVPRDYIKVEK